MQIPAFLKQDGDKLLYNQDGELLYYIPDSYFSDTKVSVASVIGQSVSTMGIFDWAIMDENGKVGKIRPFKFATIIMCKPDHIEKVKNFSINGLKSMDYRILHFKKGDEAISDVNIPQIIDNVEILFKMLILVENKMPPSIPYDHVQDYFPENMSLNSKGYGLNMQMFGLMVSELCRDPQDLSKPFRLSKQIQHSMYGYRQISVKQIPKFISPFVALTSEGWDESLMAAIQMSAEGSGVASPIERVVTGQ